MIGGDRPNRFSSRVKTSPLTMPPTTAHRRCSHVEAVGEDHAEQVQDHRVDHDDDEPVGDEDQRQQQQLEQRLDERVQQAEHAADDEVREDGVVAREEDVRHQQHRDRQREGADHPAHEERAHAEVELQVRSSRSCAPLGPPSGGTAWPARSPILSAAARPLHRGGVSRRVAGDAAARAASLASFRYRLGYSWRGRNARATTPQPGLRVGRRARRASPRVMSPPPRRRPLRHAVHPGR